MKPTNQHSLSSEDQAVMEELELSLICVFDLKLDSSCSTSFSRLVQQLKNFPPFANACDAEWVMSGDSQFAVIDDGIFRKVVIADC